MDIVERHIWDFVFWIRQTYGRPGCAVALVIILSLLALTFYLLNLLPEAKTEEIKNDFSENDLA